MAAVARLGETCARGFLDLPFSVGEESCLAPPTSIFDEAPRKNFSRRAMEATLAHLLGSPREGLFLGLVFGVVGLVKGKFLPLRGCLIFRRPRPTRRFFVENRMAKKDQKG